jgi:MoaA/NifB/PqqE/SkfB family radical SAM enzyme
MPTKHRKAYRSLNFRQPDHPGPMALWKVNQRCNFRCEYCFSAGINPYREHPGCGRYSPQHIAQSFDRTGRSWWISMTGGEPFLYPGFVQLCRELTRNHFLTIFTNLSTTNVLQFAESIDPRRVYSLNASLHIVERERRRRLDQFIAYALHFQKKGFRVRVDYVAYPPLFDRLEHDLRMLTARGIEHVSLQAFQGVYRSRLYPSGYSRQEREVFRSLSTDDRETDLIERTHSFFGQPCRGGQEFFYMNIGGEMRRCPEASRSYGNFFAGRYRLDERPRPCPYPLCLCQFLGPELAGGTRLSPIRVLGEMVLEGIPLAFNRKVLRRIGRSVCYRLRGKLLKA